MVFSAKLPLLILLMVVVLVGLVSYGDFREVGQRLATFPISRLLAALLLAAANYLLRFLRWVYYLRVLRIEVPLSVSALTFFSGLALSITPGKMGELVKSHLLRDAAGVPISASAPVVVMERLTDVAAVALLGLLGLALLPLPVSLILVAVLLLCGGITALVTTRHSDRLLGLPLLRRWRGGLRSSREGMRTLTTPPAVLVAVFLGATAWLSEGVSLWVILQGLDIEVSLLRAVPVYAAATLVGALSGLPGGLIGTEGSIVVLLQQAGVARSAASAGTLLVRLTTLWFAVIIGLISLAVLQRLRAASGPSESKGETDETAFQTPH